LNISKSAFVLCAAITPVRIFSLYSATTIYNGV
jgi:hypothetical protein